MLNMLNTHSCPFLCGIVHSVQRSHSTDKAVTTQVALCLVMMSMKKRTTCMPSHGRMLYVSRRCEHCGQDNTPLLSRQEHDVPGMRLWERLNGDLFKPCAR